MITLECKLDKIVLSGPELKDTHSIKLGLNLKRAMDNTTYTWIKKPYQEKKINFINLSRDQARQIIDFLRKHFAEEMIYTEYFLPNRPKKYLVRITSPIQVVDQALNDSRTEISMRIDGEL